MSLVTQGIPSDQPITAGIARRKSYGTNFPCFANAILQPNFLTLPDFRYRPKYINRGGASLRCPKTASLTFYKNIWACLPASLSPTTDPPPLPSQPSVSRLYSTMHPGEQSDNATFTSNRTVGDRTVSEGDVTIFKHANQSNMKLEDGQITVDVEEVGEAPDGGLQAWLNVLGSFLDLFSTFGVVNSYVNLAPCGPSLQHTTFN